MAKPVSSETAAAMLEAQDISTESAADVAKFATLVLGNSARAFATLAFEDEPSGYIAAQRRNAP
jgi:hypothetical protein